ncbi:MAG TPA: M13 family metallopeptidase [Kofleriaceae bacterium]|jgi:endothelin-converting enzyme/putative endopeptidase
MRFLPAAAVAVLPASLVIAFAVAAQPTPAPLQLPPGLDKRFVDTSADPCTNFFQYACGNFNKIFPMPSDFSSYGTGALIYEHNEAVLHAMLDKVAKPDPKRTPNEQKIGDFYATCMDTRVIDRKGIAAFKPELDRIAAITSKSELPALLGHHQLINVADFIGLGEQQDFANATLQIAALDQGGLGLPERDYYLRTGDKDEKLRQQYVQHIAKVLKLVGEPTAQAASDAKAVLALETALAKLSMDVTSRRNPKNIYHLMSVADAAKLMPSLSLDALLAAAQFPKVTQINVTNPDFMKGLSNLIDTTELATLKTYMRWQLIASADSTALPKALDDEHFAFFGKTLKGQPEQRARWKRCVQATDNALGEALGQVYVAQEFPPSSKQATVQMVHDIEGAMNRDIDTLDWMSAATKAKAKAKLHAVADKIGYPDHFRDYSKLDVKRGDAYGNAERAATFENLRQIDKIGTPVDRGEWGMSPPTVDAYYNPSMNDINFPAGILQSPMYDPSAPDAVNYGHIGGVVGHELTHGFDDEGRQFDGAGNLADWWTAADGQKFDQKAQCTVDEYSSFVAVDDVHVNGKLTLGENTADNGGLRLAYQALLADAQRKHLDLAQKQADGYTPVQEFFLGHGQNWCGDTRPEQLRLQVQTDPHSPRQFRVNGVVRNMPEFGKAFGCKLGQPMMPKTVCRTW